MLKIIAFHLVSLVVLVVGQTPLQTKYLETKVLSTPDFVDKNCKVFSQTDYSGKKILNKI